MKPFKQYIDKRIETLENYAMLLFMSGEQPTAWLSTSEQMFVEIFASRCEYEQKFNHFFKE